MGAVWRLGIETGISQPVIQGQTVSRGQYPSLMTHFSTGCPHPKLYKLVDVPSSFAIAARDETGLAEHGVGQNVENQNLLLTGGHGHVGPSP